MKDDLKAIAVSCLIIGVSLVVIYGFVFLGPRNPLGLTNLLQMWLR